MTSAGEIIMKVFFEFSPRLQNFSKRAVSYDRAFCVGGQAELELVPTNSQKYSFKTFATYGVRCKNKGREVWGARHCEAVDHRPKLRGVSLIEILGQLFIP